MMQKSIVLLLLVWASASPAISWAAPIAITSTQSLTYGSFVVNAAGGVTVGVNPLMRTANGGVTLISSSSWSAASFSVTGDMNTTYAITLPANGVVSLTSGANSMALNDFTSNPAATSGQLYASGSQTLTVGATLSVIGSQATGDYTGSFTVTVDYN